MASQQYNLRWNNHTNNLLHVLEEQFEKEVHVDVTLTCQGKFIKAHKVVLGACSPYFQEIFNRHDASTHPVIIMSGLKFEDIRAIVEFMYKGEVKVCDSDLEQLLAAAESLQVKGLSNVRATRQGHGQNVRSELKNSTKNSTGSNVSNNSTNSDLSSSRNLNGGLEKNNNSTTASISSSASHATGSHSGGRAHLFLTNNMGSASNSENLEINGTPMHLRRKRARISSNKDIKENSSTEVKSRVKVSTVIPVVEDDNSNDLPLTIKIEPPYIRDIDEEDDVEWESQKDSVAESCDGPQELKEIVVNKSSLGMSYIAGLMEPKEKIPRPPNAFMIFANEWRRKLATQHSNESNKEISVRLGIMWKNLPGDSKEDYFAASRQANEDHKKKYPDYYYSPKEARMRKKWKLQQQQCAQMMTAGQYNPVHLVKVFMNDEGEETPSHNHSGSTSEHHSASQAMTH